MAERPEPAFAGDAPYVFVSYAHEDRALVYPEIHRLQVAGIPVWYDEGIAPGGEWTDELARAIDRCSRFLFFASPNAVASRHCRSEVQYALRSDRPLITVYLEPTQLTEGLQLALGIDQAIMRYELPVEEYRRKLEQGLKLPTHDVVRGAEPDSGQRRWRWDVVFVAAAVTAATIGALLWRSNGGMEASPGAVDPSMIAVLPFVVRGPAELDFLGDGTVDLLAARLNGLPGFYATDPFAVVKVASRNPASSTDPETARRVADLLGAGRFVMGAVTGTLEELVFTAKLYSSEGAIASARTLTPANRVAQAVDELARQLIASELTEEYESYASLAALTTSSIEALQHYLQGEHAFRAGSFEIATQRFHDAARIDPEFALAWFRLVIASTLANPELGFEAQERARELRDRLPYPQRELQAIYDLGDAGRIDEARARTLKLVGTYPNDIEARRMLAEIRFRHNQYVGLDARDAAADFEHILAIDPGDTWSREYLLELAGMNRDDELIRHHLAALPADADSAVLYGVLADYLGGKRSAGDAARSLVAANYGTALWIAYYRAPRMRDRALVEAIEREIAASVGQPLRRSASLVLRASRGDWRSIRTDDLSESGEWLALAAAVAPSDGAPTNLMRTVANWLQDWDPAATGMPGCADDTAVRFGCTTAALSAARDLYLYALLQRLGDADARVVLNRLRANGNEAGPNSLAAAYAATATAHEALNEARYQDALRALSRARIGVPFLGFIRGPVASLGLLYQPLLAWNTWLTAQAHRAAGAQDAASRWYLATTQTGFWSLIWFDALSDLAPSDPVY